MQQESRSSCSMLTLLPLLLLQVPLSSSQGVGAGISKHTWTGSDPRECYHWLKRFLPVKDDAASCPDGICECATQGRLLLEGYVGPPTHRLGKPQGFALHTVNCSYHPYGELSTFDMEEIFEAKFGGWDHLDGFMDYNLGLWSHDLTSLARELEEAGESSLILRWEGEEGKQYYSLLFSPCGFQVYELISDKLDIEGLPVVEHPNMRMVWRDWNKDYVAEEPYLTPIKVSRAVSSISLVAPYYIQMLGGSLVHQETFPDGTKLIVVNAPQSTVHLQFWEGVPTGGNGWTPGDLELYLNSVHDQFMVSPTCGFDQWIDNHYAIDAGPDQDGVGPTIDELLPQLDEGGYRYHTWGGPIANESTPYSKLYTVYGSDPFGWGVQFDYPYFHPPHNLPFYSTNCKSNDGCQGQGFCEA